MLTHMEQITAISVCHEMLCDCNDMEDLLRLICTGRKALHQQMIARLQASMQEELLDPLTMSTRNILAGKLVLFCNHIARYCSVILDRL